MSATTQSLGPYRPLPASVPTLVLTAPMATQTIPPMMPSSHEVLNSMNPLLLIRYLIYYMMAPLRLLTNRPYGSFLCLVFLVLLSLVGIVALLCQKVQDVKRGARRAAHRSKTEIRRLKRSSLRRQKGVAKHIRRMRFQVNAASAKARSMSEELLDMGVSIAFQNDELLSLRASNESQTGQLKTVELKYDKLSDEHQRQTSDLSILRTKFDYKVGECVRILKAGADDLISKENDITVLQQQKDRLEAQLSDSLSNLEEANVRITDLGGHNEERRNLLSDKIESNLALLCKFKERISDTEAALSNGAREEVLFVLVDDLYDVLFTKG